jgi:hypothetical protein
MNMLRQAGHIVPGRQKLEACRDKFGQVGEDSCLAIGQQDQKEHRTEGVETPMYTISYVRNGVFSQEKYARVQRKVSMHKNYATVWSDKNKQRQA